MTRFNTFLAAVVVAFGVVAPAVQADLIPLSPADFIGSRSTDGNGLTASGNQTGGGFVLSWNINYNDQTELYTYVYSFTRENEDSVEVSHFTLGVSDTFTEKNIFDGSNVVDGPKDHSEGSLTLFGLKFDFEDDVYTLVTDRVPVWGDFIGKKGSQGNPVSGVYNIGFGVDPTNADAPFTNWVATPDTRSGPPVIPVPAAVVPGLLLMGGVALGRRMKRKA